MATGLSVGVDLWLSKSRGSRRERNIYQSYIPLLGIYLLKKWICAQYKGIINDKFFM